MKIDKTVNTGVPGEVVVALGGGDFAAVSCPVRRIPHTQQVGYFPKARWIDRAGKPKLDENGDPVETEWRFTCGKALRDANGGVLRKACARMVLGAPPLKIVDNAGEALSLVTSRKQTDITPAYKTWLAQPDRTPQGLVDALKQASTAQYDDAEVREQVSIQMAIAAAKHAMSAGDLDVGL